VVFRGELFFIGSGSRALINNNVHAELISVTLYADSRLEIGARTTCYGLRAWISDGKVIEIGEGCLLSEGVTIRTSDHHSIFDVNTLEHLNNPESVIIEPHVWLGDGAMILKGAHIGVGSIIGARSLVTRSVPPMELWSGSPARMMRKDVSWDASLPAQPSQLDARARQIKALTPSMSQPAEMRATLSQSFKNTARGWIAPIFRTFLTRSLSDHSRANREKRIPINRPEPASLVAQPDPTATEQWIEALYRKVLMREPEEGAVQAHARRAKDSGIGPAELLERFFRCEEFASASPNFVSTYIDSKDRLFDHSQSGEVSFLVKQLVNDAASQKFVVDVGARGRERSNSYDILRCFRWRGLLIEANPNLIGEIKRDFEGLDVNVINCAVADYDGEADFFFGVNDDVSSLLHHNSSGWGEIKGKCRVNVRKLSGILKEHSVPLDFDLLSLDIEGYDVAVLNELVLNSRYRPKHIIIEIYEPELISNVESAGFHPQVASEYSIAGAVGANLFLTRKTGQARATA
jgi:FkbM family methyltransferase